jgi:hypothetical protein
MNEKIEQLAKQAGMVMYPTGLGIQENTLWGDRNINKFAELIIKECIDCVGWVGKMNTNAVEPVHTANAISNRISKQFGVK